ncbi:hypothetical protein [Nonomuraea sp. NPDC049784]|uniref:hypothetical protein n=1 Tax=Nonomuraea sp. NPDC049784 TaxID=3154361 RepID=UPI0033D39998
MLGESDECFALLEQAAQTLTDHIRVREPNVPVYLHHYDLATLREQSAVCHRAAGQIGKAVAILEEQIASLAGNLARDRGHLTAKLAVAVAQEDPSRATSLGMEALTAAQQTGSARIRRELRVLDGELLQRWPECAEAGAFHDAFASM